MKALSISFIFTLFSLLSMVLGNINTEPIGGVWRIGSVIILGSWFNMPTPMYKSLGVFSNSNRGPIFAYAWAQIAREYAYSVASLLVDSFPGEDDYDLSCMYSSNLKQRNEPSMVFALFDVRHDDIAIRVLQSVFWPIAESLGVSKDRIKETEKVEELGQWQEVLDNTCYVQETLLGPCELRGYAVEYVKSPRVVTPYFADRLHC